MHMYMYNITCIRSKCLTFGNVVGDSWLLSFLLLVLFEVGQLKVSIAASLPCVRLCRKICGEHVTIEVVFDLYIHVGGVLDTKVWPN